MFFPFGFSLPRWFLLLPYSWDWTSGKSDDILVAPNAVGATPENGKAQKAPRLNAPDKLKIDEEFGMVPTGRSPALSDCCKKYWLDLTLLPGLLRLLKFFIFMTIGLLFIFWITWFGPSTSRWILMKLQDVSHTESRIAVTSAYVSRTFLLEIEIETVHSYGISMWQWICTLVALEFSFGKNTISADDWSRLRGKRVFFCPVWFFSFPLTSIFVSIMNVSSSFRNLSLL